MLRTFKEPATTWRGALLRASSWTAPHLCGSYIVGMFFDQPTRHRVMYGLLLGVVPVVLAIVYRSWRVGLASAGIAAGVAAAAFAVVWVVIRSIV